MFVRILSDVHLELCNNGLKLMRNLLPAKPLLDHSLILTGDIGNPTTKLYKQFITEMSKCYVKVFIVSGNHEYYQPAHKVYNHEQKRMGYQQGINMENIDKIIREFTTTLPNVHFLQRDSVIFDRIRFLGCTLWTIPDPTATSSMNDYKMIPGMTVSKCNELYNENVQWLSQELSLKTEEFDSTIVITHHLPSYSLISSVYKGDPLNAFYASNLDHLVNQANIWVCGHSHTPKQLKIGECQCYINPVGYTSEQTGYNKDISIAIETIINSRKLE